MDGDDVFLRDVNVESIYKKGKCKGIERTNNETSAPTDGAIDTSTFINNSIHIKQETTMAKKKLEDIIKYYPKIIVI